MNWLETMKALQKKLAKESPLGVSDELHHAVVLFNDLQREAIEYGGMTNTVSPFWMEARRIIYPPLNGELVVMKALKEVAEQNNVPLTWLYLLPFKLQIDDAAHHITFKSNGINYTDKEGYATAECLVAFHDGKKDGVIDADEPFIFAMNQFAEDYSEKANEAIDTMSKEMGVTKEKFIQMVSGESVDAPFPHENDDSPVGEV